jgi:hypothetical protein
MKKESNTIIKEAQATTINGNQELSLAFSFIFINPPNFKKYFYMLTFKHEHEFIFAFPTIKFLD